MKMDQANAVLGAAKRSKRCIMAASKPSQRPYRAVPRRSPTFLTENRAMPKSSENKADFLLITGPPGIGKTTVIRRVAQGFKPKGLQGFYTEEIREDGERRGFHLVGFDGTTTHVIAHVDFPKSCRIGKYGVDVQAVD